mmetsp:Transcript_48948/g.106561  ORF Transcript_48948/g.106561 Transcript_48948/m.106561 type:complete len:226 (+) Transcript_48948:68-745(+)
MPALKFAILFLMAAEGKRRHIMREVYVDGSAHQTLEAPGTLIATAAGGPVHVALPQEEPMPVAPTTTTTISSATANTSSPGPATTVTPTTQAAAQSTSASTSQAGSSVPQSQSLEPCAVRGATPSDDGRNCMCNARTVCKDKKAIREVEAAEDQASPGVVSQLKEVAAELSAEGTDCPFYAFNGTVWDVDVGVRKFKKDCEYCQCESRSICASSLLALMAYFLLQ